MKCMNCHAQMVERSADSVRGRVHYDVCDECGSILDIKVGCPYLGSMLDGEHKVKEVHGYFRGTCKHCLAAGAE